mgnify:CR=1 FL=1
MRRTVIVGTSGLIVAAALLRLVPCAVAVVTGWDVAALAFLLSVWPIIIRADGPRAAQLAKREDENRGSATRAVARRERCQPPRCRLRPHSCGAGGRRASGAAHRLRGANGRVVVDGGQYSSSSGSPVGTSAIRSTSTSCFVPATASLPMRTMGAQNGAIYHSMTTLTGISPDGRQLVADTAQQFDRVRSLADR